MASVARDGDKEALESEIHDLERRLAEAKSRLRGTRASTDTSVVAPEVVPTTSSPSTISTHFLLLLSDSALPVGSFAFSSGLESYLVHNPRSASFSTFLPLSVASFASTILPFTLTAYREPYSIAELDDQLDAAIICTVGRRASTAQGRALLSIWERSFRPNIDPSSTTAAEASVIRDFSDLLKKSTLAAEHPPAVSGHYAPFFGAVCTVLGLSLKQTAYIFMLGHVKALVSAAVRANVFGPYQAQKLLASNHVQYLIDTAIQREWATPVEEAGQSVPIIDLLQGRHELLYSRIFNS